MTSLLAVTERERRVRLSASQSPANALPSAANVRCKMRSVPQRCHTRLVLISLEQASETFVASAFNSNAVLLLFMISIPSLAGIPSLLGKAAN